MLTKRCVKCLLPENYPSVDFNEDRVCSYCLGRQHFGVEADPQVRPLMAQKEKLRADFERAIEAARGQAEYDCLVPLSGGKDSTYLAHLLKNEYGLRILTLTVDTGLMSPLAKPNVARVAARLNVDHIMVAPKPEFFKKLYRYFLTHPSFEKKGCEEVGYVSTVCQVCCKAIHSLVMQAAALRRIPFVALAYSPDQIEHHFYEASHREVYEQKWAPEALSREPFDDEDRRHFWDPEVFRDRHPLPRLLLPFHVIDYPGAEEVTRRTIELGLLEKRKASLFVTNCHLNWLMIHLDTHKLGYDPYVASISHQIREGRISRRRWLLLLELERIAARLGLYRKVWKRKEVREVLAHLDLNLNDLLDQNTR
jgi:hypothetical protein